MNNAASAGARLLVDCTCMLGGPHYTGIQRYLRRTLRHAQPLWGAHRTGALKAAGGQWHELTTLAAHPLEGLAALQFAPPPATATALGPQTHVLLADRFWHTGQWDALDRLLRSPARISAVVYDLLSVRNPQWFAPGVGERFARYLRLVLPRADIVVCLSGAVRADLAAWARQESLRLPRVAVVPPGHQVWAGAPSAPAGLPQAWRSGAVPFVLQVGTVEPRKNHVTTLAVMRQAWSEGSNMGCLFIGQRGWLMDEFAQSLERLPQWQRQLVWLTECTDAELDWCYRHAAAVLYPSAGEGYGLPLAEAAAAGARVIASDTPVHREVLSQLGAHAGAVRLCAPSQQAMHKALAACAAQPGRPVIGSVRTWDEATRELLQAIGLTPQTV